MAAILDAYPEYGATSHLDTMRHTEYGYLDEQDHVYLDYTGSGLAARAQHRAHAQRQAELVLGNPHSASPTSELATDLVEKTRARVLQHFNASADEYAVVFTPNATGAARLIGEAYRFGAGHESKSKKQHKAKQKLVLTSDNHNSLNGLREYARRQGVATAYVPSKQPDLHIDQQTLLDVLGPEPEISQGRLRTKSKSSRGPWQKFLSGVFCGLFDGDDVDSSETEDAETEDAETEDADHADHADHTDHDHGHERGLFAYPAQSNFSGVRHPLAWIAAAQRRGYDVLLDAAAYLPTTPLDLAAHHPDFVLVSWYKLFGYPTGVGCLVARREALARLDRPWFSGGTIRAVSVGLDWHAPAHRVEAQFEDGTVNFQAIPDVAAGLDWLSGGSVGFAALQTRVRCLTGWFLDRLVVLRHSNGRPMVRLYGPDHCLPDGSNRGGTVTFNFVDPDGALVDERIVAAEAAAARISLRTGCFCNPGAGEIALGFSLAELRVLQHLAANSKPPAPAGQGHGHGSARGGGDRSSSSNSSSSSTLTTASMSTEQVNEKGGNGESSSSSGDSFVSGTTGAADAATDDAEKKVVKSASAASLTPSTTTTTTTTASSAGDEWPIAGAVRVSFGVASNTADVDRFFAFARRAFRDRVADNTSLGPRAEC